MGELGRELKVGHIKLPKKKTNNSFCQKKQTERSPSPHPTKGRRALCFWLLGDAMRLRRVLLAQRGFTYIGGCGIALWLACCGGGGMWVVVAKRKDVPENKVP